MSAKTALITGASRGIGREMARVLYGEGWRVISAVRNPAAAPAGTQAEAVDMRNPQSIARLAERLQARNERLHALINNAAVYRSPPRETWEVNVRGPLLLTRAVDALLEPHARVVLVTSGLSARAAQPAALVKRLAHPALSLADIEHMADEAPGGYGASKAALNAMARLLARELAPRGILVNAVSPGWVRTDMGGAGAPRSVPQGAAAVLWGVRLPDDGPSGGTFEDGQPFE